MENKELIKEVFSIIGTELLKNKTTSISIHIQPETTGMSLYLEYSDEEGVELIHTIRKACIKNGIWFDSGFFTDKPIIEWNLDWSLSKGDE